MVRPPKKINSLLGFISTLGLSLSRSRCLLAFLLVAVTIASTIFTVFYLLSSEALPPPDFPAANVKPLNSHYLGTNVSGYETKFFLVHATPRYGYYRADFRVVSIPSSWIHKGDPCFIINFTLRNDYTEKEIQDLTPPFANNTRAWVGLRFELFDRNGNSIDAVSTGANGRFLPNDLFNTAMNSGDTRSWEVYLATENRNIDHFEIYIRYVSSQPEP